MTLRVGGYVAAACAFAAVLPIAAVAQAQVAAGYLVPGEQTADFAPLALARSGLFQRDGEIGVRQRPKPEFDAAPVPLGGFELRPQLAAGLGYEDNIFARPVAISDAIVTVEPQALLESAWSRHYLGAFARASSLTYLDHDSESRVDYAVGVNGRFDAARDIGLSAGASYEQDTEPRTSPSSPVNAAEPVRFTVAKAYLGGVKQFNRLRLSGQVNVRDLDYDDPTAIGGGSIYQRDRSRTETQGEAMAEYALTPAFTVFVDAVGNTRSYRNELAENPSRDSSGYDITVGSNFEITRLVTGQVQVGYLSQDYDDGRFDTVSGLSVRGLVRYYPVRLLTLTLSGSRAVQDAEVAGSSGYLASVAQLQADYEFLRQLILSAQVGFENDDFRGLDRNDDRVSAGVSAEYMINRQVGFVLAYRHIDQDSTGALRGVNYDVNRFTASLSYRF